MRKRRIVLWVSAVLLILIISLTWMERAEAPVEYSDKQTVTFVAPDGSARMLSVEVADDDAERSRGLMFRDRLPEGVGMLFIFNQSEPRSFWMKNTRIPLDILFFDADGRFVSRASMEPCTADPCPFYPSGGPARYALEMNRGESVTAMIGSGWTMQSIVQK